jgi:hypothetical protein
MSDRLDPRTRALLEAPIASTLLRLAMPNVLIMLAQATAGLVETYFIGKLGTDALAGVALARSRARGRRAARRKRSARGTAVEITCASRIAQSANDDEESEGRGGAGFGRHTRRAAAPDVVPGGSHAAAP